MSKTKTHKAETVEGLGAQIVEMEAELADGHGRPLSWDEVTSTTADELARKEQRRGVLPRLIRAAKVKRLELEKRGRVEEATALREKLESTYAALQEEEEALLAAKEKRDAAWSEWSITLSSFQGANERARRTERELREFQEGR